MNSLFKGTEAPSGILGGEAGWLRRKLKGLAARSSLWSPPHQAPTIQALNTIHIPGQGRGPERKKSHFEFLILMLYNEW